MGRCCFLIGPPFMAKTPLVKQIAHKIATETPYKVQYTNFEKVQGESWEETCLKILEPLYANVDQQPNFSLYEGFQRFIENNVDIPRLVIAFDDLEYLSGEQILELAYQCHAIYTDGGVDPNLGKISMLWAGDEDLIQGTFGLKDAFIRNTEQYSIGCYSRKEFDETLSAQGHEIPLSENVREKLWQLGGGHPPLSRNYGDCFMSRALYALQSSPEISGDIVALDEAADKFVREAIDSLESTGDSEPSLFSEVASRIENSVALLNIISVIINGQQQKRFPDNVQDVIQRNDDFLVRDKGNIVIRSKILDKFTRLYFDDKRLGDCYFIHYEDVSTWGKSMECYKKDKAIDRRNKNSRVNTPTGKTLLNLVEIASHRFHRFDTKDVILKALSEIIHYVIGVSACGLFEMKDGKPILRFSMPDDARRRIVKQLLSGPLPYAVKAAINTGEISTQGSDRQICIPIYLEGKIQYFVWADVRGEPPSTPLTKHEMSLLTTLCKFAEGPLSTVESRERNHKQLEARDKEITFFRQLTKVAPPESDYLTPVLENARRCLELLGYQVQIKCQDLLIGEERIVGHRISMRANDNQQSDRVISTDSEYTRNWDVIPIPADNDGNMGEILIATDSKRIGDESDFLKAFGQQLGAHITESWESRMGQIYRFVFDNVGTGLQVLDADYNVLALNKTLEKLVRERDGFEGSWRGKKCYEIHRQTGSKKCSNCTVEKAETARDTITAVENWHSPKFPDKKELWHKVTSTPIFDKEYQMVGAVERSRPLDVHDVFAEIGEKMFMEMNPDVIREEITKGVLMLGFDRARLYWIDPNSGLLTEKVRIGAGLESSKKGIVIGQNSPHFEVFAPIQQGDVSLVRREMLAEKKLPKILEEDVKFFYLEPFPFQEELQHQNTPEIIIVPLFSTSDYMGAIAADYNLSQQFITDDDIRKLRQYAWLAAQFIQGAEYRVYHHLADLVRRLSHQTLTPLQAISFQLDLMQIGSDDQRQAAYNTISQTIRRLATTFSVHSRFVKITSLAEYDMLLQETVSEYLETVEVKSLFEEQRELFSALCRMQKSEFRIGNTKSGKGEITIDIHRDIFFEALTNIVQNAVQAIPSGWERRVIELKAHRRKGIHISVSDSGVGIPTNLWEKVFEPFYPPKSRGSGIGLFVTRKNLEAHGFVVKIVKPTFKLGTTVRITIPEGGTNEKSLSRRRRN